MKNAVSEISVRPRMASFLVTKTIQIEYWSCGNHRNCHRHKTQAHAEQCISKRKRKLRPLYPWDLLQTIWTTRTKGLLFTHVLNGGTFGEYAIMIGVSEPRVRQVFGKLKKDLSASARLELSLREFADRSTSISSMRKNRQWWFDRLNEWRYGQKT